MSSIFGRLWRIGKAYVQSHPEKLEEEVRKWEEEIRKQEKTKNSGHKAARQSGIEDIADAFRTLEVEIGADYEICHKAYRRLAQKYHPDQWHDPEKEEIAKKLFQLISEAFTRIKKIYGKR